jgi:hypothetical protein
MLTSSIWFDSRENGPRVKRGVRGSRVRQVVANDDALRKRSREESGPAHEIAAGVIGVIWRQPADGRAARLRHSQAAIEDVDYRTPRRLDKALFQQLATCRWIAEHRGLLVTGPCGVGKSGVGDRDRLERLIGIAGMLRLVAELEQLEPDGRNSGRPAG